MDEGKPDKIGGEGRGRRGMDEEGKKEGRLGGVLRP